MNREQMLIATIRAYFILAVKLKSLYYCKRCRESFQLLKVERANRTEIIYVKAA